MSVRKKSLNILACTCERCGYEWNSIKSDPPKVCGRCKSPYWNVPKNLKGGQD